MLVVGGHEIAALLVGEFSKETNLLRSDRDIACNKLTDRTGRRNCLELSERLGLALDQVGPSPQHVGSLARTPAAPVAGPQSLPGGLDRLVHDLLRGDGTLG